MLETKCLNFRIFLGNVLRVQKTVHKMIRFKS